MAIYTREPCSEAAVRASPDHESCTPATGRWVLAATIVGSSMAFVDATVVNVALPVLQTELDATVVELQWVVESYALFLAALILVGGMMGDLFGRRRMFGIGVVAFAVASVWCGLAPDVPQLIVARAAQGLGAALLVPGSLALISATFSEEQRGRAIGTWSGLTALAMALGPVLGGWLVDNVSWRWIFFLNVPLAFVVVAILVFFVPESRGESGKIRLDGRGAFLVTLGLGAVVFGLIEGGPRGFADPLVLGALAIGVLGLVGFVLVEARGEAPMMPLGLFRSRLFSGANLVTLLLYGALSGGLFFVPFNLVQVEGYSATEAGAAFLPLVLIVGILSRWSGGLTDRYGGRAPLVVGQLIAAAGFALFAVPAIGEGYWSSVFPAMTVLGLGVAISAAPVTTVVMGAVEERRAGIASGINNAVSRIAGLLAIAVMGIFVLMAFNSGLDGDLATLDLSPDLLQALDGERIKLAGAEVPPGIDTALRATLERAIAEAFVSGYRLIMLISAGLALLGAASAFFMLQRHAAPARAGS